MKKNLRWLKLSPYDRSKGLPNNVDRTNSDLKLVVWLGFLSSGSKSAAPNDLERPAPNTPVVRGLISPVRAFNIN